MTVELYQPHDNRDQTCIDNPKIYKYAPVDGEIISNVIQH
jgi:hypothetical protein